MNGTNKKVRMITFSGLFAAVIFVVTLIHVPTGNGYTHAGDGVIYLAASLLPMPYAIAASALGGLLADGLSGAAIWIPATIVVKMITAAFFTSKKDKIISLRNILAIIPSLAVCIAGYSLYEAQFILGGISASTLTAAFLEFPAYIVQVAASTALYIIVGLFLDKIKFKKYFE